MIIQTDRFLFFGAVDWLQAHVFSEMDESFHQSSNLFKLFSTSPVTFSPTAFLILTLNQVSVDLIVKLANFDKALDVVTEVFVVSQIQSVFPELFSDLVFARFFIELFWF